MSRFFSRPAYLTASAQLHLEAMTSTLGKVYTLSPAFRAEKSLTRHHLAEFYMLEAESIDMRDLDQLMNLAEDFLRQSSLKTLNRLTNDRLTSFESSSTHLNTLIEMFESKKRFERVTYEQAIDILNSLKKRKFPRIKFGQDLSKEHERLLVESFGGKTPVFVTRYPYEIKPFYMRRALDDSRFCENFDLLVPKVGEIIGGSLREYRLDVLNEAMQRQDLSMAANYSLYLETKKYGAMRLGGFGLGLERFVQFLFDIENIRDTCAFPRYLYNCKM